MTLLTFVKLAKNSKKFMSSFYVSKSPFLFFWWKYQILFNYLALILKKNETTLVLYYKKLQLVFLDQEFYKP